MDYDPHHHNCEDMTPEQDEALAEILLGDGALEHAAFHAACALVESPDDPRRLSLFDAIAALSDEPGTLLPPREGNYVGLVAGRARILALGGQYGRALDMLLEVLRANPGSAYLSWARQWAVAPSLGDQPVPWAALGGLLATLCGPLVGRARLWPSEQRALEHFAPLMEALTDHIERCDEPVAAIMLGGFWRRLRKPALALACVELALEGDTGAMGYSALGLALRAANQPEAAAKAFATASLLAPEDPAHDAEQGRAHWDAGDFEGAMEAFAKALEKAPEDHEIYWSLLYTAQCSGATFEGDDPSWLEEVVGEALIADDMHWLMQPCLGSLPQPTAAVVQALEHLRDHYEAPPLGLSFKLSALEPPSALSAMAMWVCDSPEPSMLDVEVEGIQDPDPRVALGPAALDTGHLWAYDGVVPSPTLPPPPPELQVVIADWIVVPYFLPRWWRLAAAHAERFKALTDAELLAALVHVPTCPPETPHELWVQRGQLCAALLVARLDEGWHNSRRRRLLRSVLLGPMDWTTNAAIIAMTQVALETPDALEEIAADFETLAQHIPTQNHCCCIETLAICYAMLPCRPAHAQAHIQELWRLHSTLTE